MREEVQAYLISQPNPTSSPVGSVTQIPFSQINNPEDGDVVIKVDYSSINYKDALAGLGKGKILRKIPLIGGIDLAGRVTESSDPKFPVNSNVLVNGCGLSETHNGGYAAYARVPGAWCVALPPQMTTRDAMIYGTAGFTAALALYRMMINGQTRELGPILVSGASGGVGLLSILIGSKLGFEMWALSSKKDQHEKILSMGAARAMTLDELALGSRPLESVRFGGVIDNLGGEFLSRVLGHVELWGNVAAIGLAANAKIEATVMPFILRGVSLLGASSANCTPQLRQHIWQLLAEDWRPTGLNQIVAGEVSLEGLNEVFNKIYENKSFGRWLVKVD